MVAEADLAQSEQAGRWAQDACCDRESAPRYEMGQDGVTLRRRWQATPYDWMDVLTAAFEEETEWAPGLLGGVVMLGARTSKYSRRKTGDFLTFIHAEFSGRVRWSDSSVEKLAQFAPPSRRVA